MNKKYKVIALIGKAGAGKDYLLNSVLKNDTESKFHKIVSYTSRPPRDNEIHGIDYFFCSKEEFEQKIKNNSMLEYTLFNGWYYGTAFSSLAEDKINIGAFNPAGIYSLADYSNIDTKVFYLTINDKDRLLRQLNREENPNVNEIMRRFLADKDDFSNLTFDYTLFDFDDPSCLNPTLYILNLPWAN